MLDTLNNNGTENAAAPETKTVAQPDVALPDGLPPKFWDETAKSVRMDAMIKSYGELERKLGAHPVPDVPESSDDYGIAARNLQLDADAEVNARLHQAGFTQDQARLVYELANEKLMPMLTGIAQDYEAEAQIKHLESHFGGPERWRETSRQLKTWGQANLPGEVFDALTGTRDGVLTLHRMMESGEPGIGAGAGTASSDGERSVKDLMNDPRYWRDRDPAMVEKVRQGFRSLYPET